MIDRPIRCGLARRALGWTFVIVVLLVSASTAQAQQECNAGEFPDVVVGDLHQTLRYGVVGDVTGFSVGTVSCNVGTCWLNWFANGTEHPVIGQAMFRLMDGRFEQVGQSWLKHGFTALSQDLCATQDDPCQPPPNGTHLGIYCSDPYSAFLNGDQDGLGPKFEVNPATGQYLWPPTDYSQTGDAIYKRLQVHNDDLNPVLNPGAEYFVEGQYVTRDDAAAGKMNNNSSYRSIDVTGSSGNYDISLTGSTVREQAGMFAWQNTQPGVKVVTVGIPGEPSTCNVTFGNCAQVLLGYTITDNGDGTWHYEYAIQNQTSDRSIASFSIPVADFVYLTNVEFHDVEYHSGEPYDGTDWIPDRSGGALSWETVQTHAENPDGNAIRWGTLYNFRFDSAIPPGAGAFTTLGLFKPGTPNTVDAFVRLPATCAEGSDIDGDTYAGCDCNDSDDTAWGQPGEATDLLMNHDDLTGTSFDWTAPGQLGGSVAGTAYDLLRAEDSFDFTTATCLPDPTMDMDDPLPGSLWAYLVRARSGCLAGAEGPLGSDSAGNERVGSNCP